MLELKIELRKYWFALREKAKCTQEEALWIILDILERNEQEYLFKINGSDRELAVEECADFDKIVENFKMKLKEKT